MISVREWKGVYRREEEIVTNSSSFFRLVATHTQTLTYKFNELNEGEKTPVSTRALHRGAATDRRVVYVLNFYVFFLLYGRS